MNYELWKVICMCLISFFAGIYIMALYAESVLREEGRKFADEKEALINRILKRETESE